MISAIHPSNRSLDYSLGYIQYYTRNKDGLQMDVNKSVLVAMTMASAGVVQLLQERDGGVHH